MTQTLSKAPLPIRDERIGKRNPLQKMLGRPEVGALVGAIVLFIFFSLVSPTFLQPASFATVLYGSSTIGIMAVGVSLLMIGGEFDLSTGVAVISSALTASMFSWYFSTNVWVGVGSGPAGVAGYRLYQRLDPDEDQASELHRHPGHVPDADGPEPWL